ncbi:hypothetical protein [Actinoplanes auranticolor]|uniref:Uncharacterized protein n=1 Tax=Actinoplanes auranticolor TaxID=47988 RepID=A0A919VSA2_9ACTN|nr:hypothetical protein [Actinoplanes auranticolor]GIM76944.1 hypothetical protein Aau02nite_73440 [Actinoplanes auranticolor]
MPDDILVADNSTVRLDDRAGQPFSDARRTMTLTRLGDLVDQGVVDTDGELRQLAEAATTVTRDALADVAVHRSRRFVPGSLRPDLGRYPRMLAALPTAERTKISTFWRIARQFDPAVIATHGLDRDTVLPGKPQIVKWLFQDVTVNPGGTLLLTDFNAALACRNLLIRSNARIVASGKSLQITATSIKGE